MRLAGTVNWKTGRYARIVQADLALAPYPIAQLVGDLPEPAPPRPLRSARARSGHGEGDHADPYKRIAPPEYFEVLAGVAVPRSGTGALPLPHTPRPGPVLRRRAGRLAGLVLPVLRRRRRDLRPGLGAARRPDRPGAARRGVQARAGLRPRRVRRADMSSRDELFVVRRPGAAQRGAGRTRGPGVHEPAPGARTSAAAGRAGARPNGRGERRARALLAPAGRRRPAQHHAATRELTRQTPTCGAPVPGRSGCRNPPEGRYGWQQSSSTPPRRRGDGRRRAIAWWPG